MELVCECNEATYQKTVVEIIKTSLTSKKRTKHSLGMKVRERKPKPFQKLSKKPKLKQKSIFGTKKKIIQNYTKIHILDFQGKRYGIEKEKS